MASKQMLLTSSSVSSIRHLSVLADSSGNVATLWMKAGCFGPCPTLAGKKIPEYMILPENHMAILNENSCYAKFAEEVRNAPEVETVYLVTDSDADYRNMSRGLNGKQTYQLYRDYLDNFRINSRR